MQYDPYSFQVVLFQSIGIFNESRPVVKDR